MFGIFDGFDSICACHRFKVGEFEVVLFGFGAIFISIAGLDLTLKLLSKIPKLLSKIQNCCSKLLFKIVVIDTVSFLNLFLPLNVVSHWYPDSLYAC